MLQVVRALHHLGAHAEVLSLNPRKQHVSLDEARAALAPIGFAAVDIDTSAHLTALRRSFSLRAPQLVARFYSPSFDVLLRRTLTESPWDVVQIESPFLLPYLHTIRDSSRAAVVLRSLNVEFTIWERLAERQTSLARRAFMRRIASSLRRYEVSRLDACDAIVPITSLDAEMYRSLGATVPIHVLPGGIELAGGTHVPAPELPGSAGFLGSLDYRPNQEAALWIAEELQPRVAAGARLHIAGSRAPAWLRARLERSKVTFVGEVDDARAFIESMSVMLAPIFSGGGMRIKILDAMAAAKPVISTTVGAEGIDVADGRDIVIADDVTLFAKRMHELLEDAPRRKVIGVAARSLIESGYSPVALARPLLSFYATLALR
jgi:polysaccharide biosynthesis protein PslH